MHPSLASLEMRRPSKPLTLVGLMTTHLYLLQNWDAPRSANDMTGQRLFRATYLAINYPTRQPNILGYSNTERLTQDTGILKEDD